MLVLCEATDILTAEDYVNNRKITANDFFRILLNLFNIELLQPVEPGEAEVNVVVLDDEDEEGQVDDAEVNEAEVDEAEDD